MPFTKPLWVPELPFHLPDDIDVYDFMFDERYGRQPLILSRPPFVSGLTGKSYTAFEVKNRIEHLAGGLSKELTWKPNEGSEWDKVVGLFAENSIDYMTVVWAIHRLGGIVTPANITYSASELTYQLKSSKSRCLFTSAQWIETAEVAAEAVGITKDNIFVLESPGLPAPQQFKTIEQLIVQGVNSETLGTLTLRRGESAQRVSFLCYSSGTSGLPKGVMITHQNVVSSVLQMCTFQSRSRRERAAREGRSDTSEVALGLLPLSHIYGLIVIAHGGVYRGDATVVLSKFEPDSYLKAIETYKINQLFVVPPIVVFMVNHKTLLDKHDLNSVTGVFTGAAPLGREVAETLQNLYPSWIIAQGYGLTETCALVCASAAHDIWFGSSGSLLPSFKARLIAPNGTEITEYDEPGELWVKAPAVALGYLNDSRATLETFIDGYMRTGDEVIIRKHPASGHEHLFIVDRMKELIKVNGFQVAPAELEAHLLTHPAVYDCAVIQVHAPRVGEVPKAFVVKSSSIHPGCSDESTARDIQKHVEDHKARHKWLKGGVEFIDVIPKSPSGKILRRMLRDREKGAKGKLGAKM
ncbi:hypothetical protein NM208_g1056 [Fusarium decemcellulare]|uniref:Uncharacterized protein n=1 Tax=Fusarium decemcellulare TaxID=57161 RepID=A0ACC1SXD6_9HYPO|nr:hypothetical protein NM208_g1056 [Fusarium decemcellulare]